MTQDPPTDGPTPGQTQPPPLADQADRAHAVLHDPALAGLRAVSAHIGADPRQVQGGGGNTSLKRHGVLWIKASGRWLARAHEEPMFVPLDLAAVIAGLAADDAEAAQRAVLSARCPPGLRPSIETSLHALMPHPVVLHAHSIAPLGWLVCAGGRERFETRLAGLRWAQVPYARPGLALTHAVAQALAAGPADVVLLDNHGVVVGADEPQAALELLLEVSARLELPPAAEGRVSHGQKDDAAGAAHASGAAGAAHASGAAGVPAPARPSPDDAAFATLEAAVRGSDYRLSPDPACHALAREAHRLAFAAGGAPYPDHVVFLGAGLPMLEVPAAADAEAAARWRDALAALGAPAVLVRGVGVLVHRELDAGGEAMLRGLADVAAALPPGGVPRYLPAEEVQALQHWDAEKFRRAQV